jgi:hypothetical protein
MKYILPLFLSVWLMSGCAKVTTDFSNCTKPAKPIVRDTALFYNSGDAVLANITSTGDLLFWGPRDGSSQVKNGTQIIINQNVTGTSVYNTYMAWSFHNGCFSDTTYFSVNQRHFGTIGAPLCSAQSNYLNFYGFTPVYLNYGSYNSNYYFNYISASDASYSATLNIYFPTTITPMTGYYYKLDSTSNFNNGEAYVAIYDQNNNLIYNSVSGNVYIVQINSYYNQAVFCNVRFRTPSGYLSCTGSLLYQ